MLKLSSPNWAPKLTILAVVNLMLIVIPVIGILFFEHAGVAILAIPFALLLLVGYGVVFINVLVLAFYLAQARPRGRRLVLALGSMVVSVGLSIFIVLAQLNPHMFDEMLKGMSGDEAAIWIRNCSVEKIVRQDKVIKLTMSGNGYSDNEYNVSLKEYDTLMAAVEESKTKCTGPEVIN